MRPEVRRAGRPDRADAGGRQQAYHRLRRVRQVRGNAVAAPHPEGDQRRADRRHLLVELGVAQAAPMTGLRPVDDRRSVRVRAGCPQNVARIVERRIGEPGDGRHRAALQHRRIAAAPEDAKVMPERRPELCRLRDRPLPQSAVSFAGADAPVGGEPARVVRDLGPLDVRLRRLRQDRAVAASGRQVLLRRRLLLPHFTAPDRLKGRLYQYESPMAPEVGQPLAARPGRRQDAGLKP